MGYSSDDSMVRVDFWKPSGKWSATEALKWTGSYTSDIFKAFAESLRRLLWDEENQRLRYSGMRVTCLEPYHANAHPLSSGHQRRHGPQAGRRTGPGCERPLPLS